MASSRHCAAWLNSTVSNPIVQIFRLARLVLRTWWPRVRQYRPRVACGRPMATSRDTLKRSGHVTTM